MTKKLLCLLLAAMLGVSMIALLAACRGDEQTHPPQAASSTVTAPESSSSLTDTPDAADVLSPQVPSEEAET